MFCKSKRPPVLCVFLFPRGQLSLFGTPHPKKNAVESKKTSWARDHLRIHCHLVDRELHRGNPRGHALAEHIVLKPAALGTLAIRLLELDPGTHPSLVERNERARQIVRLDGGFLRFGFSAKAFSRDKIRMKVIIFSN